MLNRVFTVLIQPQYFDGIRLRLLDNNGVLEEYVTDDSHALSYIQQKLSELIRQYNLTNANAEICISTAITPYWYKQFRDTLKLPDAKVIVEEVSHDETLYMC